MMNIIYSYMDSTGYFLECCVMLWIIQRALGKRFPKLTWISIILSGFVYSTAIYVLDFSVYSVQISLLKLFLLFGLSFIISKNEISRRLLIVSTCVFLLETVSVIASFISIYTMAITADLQIRLVLLQMLPDVRFIYLVIYLAILMIVAVALRNFFPKFQEIRRGYCYVGSGFIIAVDLLIELLLMMMVYRSETLSRFTTILMWIFMALSVIALIVAFTYISTAQQVRTEQQVILATNETMSEGYKVLAEKNDDLRRMSHDFKHHLLAMQNMEPEEVQAYIARLTQQQTMQRGSQIHTGDRYVDAVLNSRQKRMEDLHIRFEHHTAIPEALPFSAADICAVVSNQLDNAIEACEKMEEDQERWIVYEISQQGNMWFFRCENSIVPGSLHTGAKLFTTKADKESHGFGLKSLKTIAERNHGSLEHQIRDDRFLSVFSGMDFRTSKSIVWTENERN